MKRPIKRLTALVLAVSFAAGIFQMTGCSRNGDGSGNVARNEEVEVQADSEWFNVSESSIDSGYDPADVDYVSSEFVGMYDGGILLRVNVSLKIPNDFDWENGNIDSYFRDELKLFDLNGQVVKSMDLGAAHDTDSYIESLEVTDGQIVASVNSWDDVTFESTYTKRVVDLDSGSLGETIDTVEISEGTDEYMEGIFVVDGYTVTKYYCWEEDGGASYRLNVVSPSGSSMDVRTTTAFPGVSIWDISNMVKTGPGKSMLITSTDDGVKYIEMDLDSGAMTEIPESDMEWLDGVNFAWGEYVDGFGYAVLDSSGITKIDFENKTIEKTFDFNNCNIDRSEIGMMNIVSISDDECVLCGDIYPEYAPYASLLSEFKIVTLTRASENPNTGKTLLTLADLSGLDSRVSRAIVDFNEQSSDYFITVDFSYSIDYMDMCYACGDGPEDYATSEKALQADLSDRLAIDLLNGEGPDIIVNGFNLIQLDNADYMTDLTDYLNETGTEGMFSNVFDAAYYNGALYQIPLGFAISGIMTDKDSVSQDQKGFTFDQYETFVDEVCNGKDPMGYGRSMFLITCMEAMNDVFIVDGEANFSCEEFEQLAQYTKDHVNEQIDIDYSVSGGMSYYDDGSSEQLAGAYNEGIVFQFFADGMGVGTPGRRTIVGIPSADGRGPQINPTVSAGISSTAASPDGCWEFISYMMSDDVQRAISVSAIPVEISAYESSAEDFITAYNDYLENGNFSASGYVVMDDTIMEPLDESLVGEFEDVILSCESARLSDPSVSIIVSEEIQAYLEGQKSLDETIDILQDRVQTVLDERG